LDKCSSARLLLIIERRHRRLDVARLGFAVVAGRSMLPTLRPGDRLLVRHGARPRTNRLAVVALPDRPWSVKRVVAERPDGWWVERDSLTEGVDSWSLGRAVPPEDVVGVVIARVWPRPSLLRGGDPRAVRSGSGPEG
jgi:hypothetical protein